MSETRDDPGAVRGGLPPDPLADRPGIVGLWIRSNRRLAGFSDQFSAVVCALLIIVTAISVVVYQGGIAIAWLDDVLRMLLIWLVFLGAVPLCFRNDHIAMDALYALLPRAPKKAVDVFIQLLGAALCLLVAVVGYESLMQTIEQGELLPAGYIPAWTQYLALPVCFGLMTISFVSRLFRLFVGDE